MKAREYAESQKKLADIYKLLEESGDHSTANLALIIQQLLTERQLGELSDVLSKAQSIEERDSILESLIRGVSEGFTRGAIKGLL